MLVACKSCNRQYDVADHEPGAKVRCFCGAVCIVPNQRPRDLRMLHCSSCGGNLEKGATQCAYCGSEVTLGERGLGEACPHCFCRMVAGSKFCSSCGASIEPQAVIKAMTSQHCPRCKHGLSLCEVGDVSFVECTSCAGIWLGEDVFTRVAEKREESAVSSYIKTNNRAVRAADGKKAATSRKVGYVPCPVCGQMMNRKNFANTSGVIIDWCRGHGYWFDADELERIMAFIESGGVEHARELERERARLEAKRIRRRNNQMPADVRASMAGSWTRRSDRSLLDTLADFIGAMLR